MTFKLRSRLRGAHVHVTLFVGDDADHLQSTGELVMDVEQWCLLNMMLASGGRLARDGGGIPVEILREYEPDSIGPLNQRLHDYVAPLQANEKKKD